MHPRNDIEISLSGEISMKHMILAGITVFALALPVAG